MRYGSRGLGYEILILDTYIFKSSCNIFDAKLVRYANYMGQTVPTYLPT